MYYSIIIVNQVLLNTFPQQERWVTIRDEATHKLLVRNLAWQKDSKGPRGRALLNDIPSVGLKKKKTIASNRQEPCRTWALASTNTTSRPRDRFECVSGADPRKLQRDTVARSYARRFIQARKH